MDSDDNSGSDSYDSFSDEEIEDFILPSLGDVAPDSGESLPCSQEDNDAIRDGAARVMEGEMSFVEFEGVIEKKSGSARVLCPAVAALIGQANMSFVRGNHDETLRLCKEAIRIDPRAAEPYRTMSELYEELGEHEKALQLGMLAAAMGFKDAESWVVLGDKAVDLEKTREALTCYAKALRINRSLVELYPIMIKLYDPDKEKKLIITAYQKMVKNAPVEHGRAILEYAQAGAQLLHEVNDMEGALALLETAFSRASDYVELDDVNLIVELFITLKKYEKSLEMISRHCDVAIEAEDDLVADETSSELMSTGALRVIKCTINGDIPLQIRTKLIVVLVHLKAYHLIDPIVTPLLEAVEEYGDLLLDIIEVFMADDRNADAVKLLKVLINSTNFSLPQVWLHYADSLRKCGRKEEAVSAYLVVMDQAPQLTDARLVVSELLNVLGRSDEAISALTQDPDSAFFDVGLLFERCLLLKDNPAREMDFLAVGRLLLSRHCARFRNRKEFCNFVRYTRSLRQTDKKIQELDPGEPMYIEGKRMPTGDEEYDLLKSLCKTAFDTQQYTLLQRLACSALGSKVFCLSLARESEIYGLAALSAFYNRDTYAGQAFFKHMVAHGYDTPRTWNLFNLFLMPTEDFRQQKYIIRLLARNPAHAALSLIFANNCFTAGSYKQALSEYLLQFKHEQTPLLALMIAITCIHLACQKSASSINALVTQAMGFIDQYRKLRGPECAQEAHYNLGRLNHQLSILPTALYHYHQVLETPAPCEMFDLKREAAYNIARIYQASNSYDLARYYVQKYIVV